ncbi:L,D-transpeptidase family protein [Streptomyces crystallinus]|uniref:L,D-TPase catalytic domain-containing protein n=1 Tax=Streptomyces crystallinus TaxID=68191 RepID=A0ABN1FSY6_9ACTN
MSTVRGKAKFAYGAVVAMAVTGIGVLPAHAAPAHAKAAQQQSAVSATGSTGKAAASRSYTYLSFKINRKDTSNSRLSLVYVQVVNPDKVRTYTVKTWRAGSGTGSTNSCLKNRGVLPSGEYKIQQFEAHKDGGRGGIHGLAWYIGEHRCKPGGVKRDALFVHSEMLPNGKQGSTEPYRWDGNSDYKSNGCIKLKPSDARDLAGFRSNYPHPGKLYVS